MGSLSAFQLEPQYRDYVWGGSQLRPGQRTAEVWAVYAGNVINSGPLRGRTLAEAAELEGAALLGQRVVERFGRGTDGSGAAGGRFPLLIKLLDCAEWLSLQVHPNDEQAAALAGPGQYGKTEAWHILQAAQGAEILCGFKPGVDRETALQSVRAGTLLEHARRLPMHTGQTIFIPAGTLHALGPGLLVYEVQQSSDITYRVFDWNRPASAGRKLHIEESLAVLDTAAASQPLPPPAGQPGQARLVGCPYFTLDLLSASGQPLALDPQEQTFHALTVIEGSAVLEGTGWQLPLGRFASAVVPANAGAYRLIPDGNARVLAASVE